MHTYIMSDDIICLSSDDEFEGPPSKKNKRNGGGVKDALDKLNKLKDITAAPCLEKKPFFKKNNGEEEQCRLTIVIEADEKSNKYKENENNIVSLLDESFEDFLPEQKDSMSSDCLIVGSDSEPETIIVSSPEKHITPIKVLENVEPPKKSPSPEVEITKEKQNGEIKDHDDEPRLEKILEEIKVPNNDILNRPSTSKASDAHKLLDEFLEVCMKSLQGCSRYENKVFPKFPIMKHNFEKCSGIHKEPNFIKMLQEYIITAKISAAEAVVSFQRIHAYLLDFINGDSIEVDEKDLQKIKKLEATCTKLLKKLRILENAELNFDDDDDSTYIQIDRYSQRLTKVYNKYCQLLKKNPYAGRLLYERIQFVSSSSNEINRAITKSLKSNKFPTYYDIEKVVRKCNIKSNLGLSESAVKEESKQCFTKLGNLLQMRRKKELYEVHGTFIALAEDPANIDECLKTKLQESLQDGDRKMKEVVDKYAKMQESNVNIDLSEDSDDSNYKDSESETDE